METLAIILATALGPIAAVLITLWHQDRAQKRGAMQRLFITLMAHRKSFPPAVEWVRALNLIDVIYSGHPKVVGAWHSLYDYMHVKPIDMKQFEHRHIELLTAMAKVLGYDIQQTDIDKFYSPQAHGDQAALNAQMNTEFLNFLRNIQELLQKANMALPGLPGQTQQPIVEKLPGEQTKA